MEKANLLPNYDFLKPIKSELEFMVGFNHVVTEYLSGMFVSLVRSKNVVEDSDLSIHMMVRQIITLQDSISPLIQHGKSDAIKLIIRANLELILQLLFMVQNDSKIRSLCYLYSTEYKELIQLKNYFSDSNDAEMARDKLSGKKIDEILLINFKNQIKDKEDLFKTELFKPIEQLILNFHHSKPWYFIVDNSIQSIETLSRKLGMHFHYYDGFYRILSKTTHSSDVKAGKFNVSDGNIFYYDVRFPFDLVENVKLNLLIISKFIQDFTKSYMNNDFENYKNWYEENFLIQLQILEKIKITNEISK